MTRTVDIITVTMPTIVTMAAAPVCQFGAQPIACGADADPTKPPMP